MDKQTEQNQNRADMGRDTTQRPRPFALRLSSDEAQLLADELWHGAERHAHREPKRAAEIANLRKRLFEACEHRISA